MTRKVNIQYKTMSKSPHRWTNHAVCMLNKLPSHNIFDDKLDSYKQVHYRSKRAIQRQIESTSKEM